MKRCLFPEVPQVKVPHLQLRDSPLADVTLLFRELGLSTVFVPVTMRVLSVQVLHFSFVQLVPANLQMPGWPLGLRGITRELYCRSHH